MTKRADGKFKKVPRDLYRTPAKAIAPLLPYLPAGTHFIDPCAGDGFMAAFLVEHGHVCVSASDVKPAKPLKTRSGYEHVAVHHADMFSLTLRPLVITNPPWSLLDEVLGHVREAWLLLPADWMHTRRSQPHLGRCSAIVSVGRVSWMNNGKGGFDNAAWYRFQVKGPWPTLFVNSW